MMPDSISMLSYNPEKVLTIVSAFFDVLKERVCPFCARITVHISKGYLRQTHCSAERQEYIASKNLLDKGVRILRIMMFCFKSKNEIENLKGYIIKNQSIKCASVKQNKRPGSKHPVWW